MTFTPRPHRPHSPPDYALACLHALASAGLGHFISIGGAFGLAHYHEYRNTHDVDAWWVEPVTRELARAVVHELRQALSQSGAVRVREWGDVTSVELIEDKHVVFSFQIAKRSAQLRPLEVGVWPGGLAVDSFDDLVASKMVALVNRGAPRDFLDIYELCQAGKCDIPTCWKLWQERQAQADETADSSSAALAIRTHLARIEKVRPLSDIENADERKSAARLRRWFAEEFCRDVA